MCIYALKITHALPKKHHAYFWRVWMGKFVFTSFWAILNNMISKTRLSSYIIRESEQS